MRTPYRLLTYLVITISFVSFFQKLLDLGISSVFLDFIEYYRLISSYIIGMPARMLGLVLPQPLIDMWMVSLIGAGSYVMTPGIEGCRAFRNLHLKHFPTSLKTGLFLAFGFSGIGILIVFSALDPLTYCDDMHNEPLDLMRGTGINILIVTGWVILFFIANAFAPSLG